VTTLQTGVTWRPPYLCVSLSVWLGWGSAELISEASSGTQTVNCSFDGIRPLPSSPSSDQAAAFQPFFRSHAHIDTKRREPWLFSTGEMSLIRAAVRSRYALLPFWYTLFYEQDQTGVPPMRPLWYEFPEDAGSHAVEGSHMVGEALLVAPVLHKGATQVSVYFPGSGPATQVSVHFPGSGPWYDYWTQEKLDVSGTVSVAAPYEKVPVFQRAGTIVPRRERVRRSSALMHEDPVSLVVALDAGGRAKGRLYLDDGKSFGYREGASIYVEFVWDNGKMEAKMVHPPGMETAVWLERVTVIGAAPASGPARVSQAEGESSAETLYDFTKKVLTIRKPAVNLGHPWTIQL